MGEKVRQTVAQIFRDTATDEQWKEMVSEHDLLSNDEFKDKYGFTWSAVMKDAVDKGLYTKKKNVGGQASKNEAGDNRCRRDFIVDDIPKGIKKKQRSIELYEDIATRLNFIQFIYSFIVSQRLTIFFLFSVQSSFSMESLAEAMAAFRYSKSG